MISKGHFYTTDNISKFLLTQALMNWTIFNDLNTNLESILFKQLWQSEIQPWYLVLWLSILLLNQSNNLLLIQQGCWYNHDDTEC